MAIYQYEYARWYADQRSSTVSLSQQRKTALICTGIYFGFRKVRWYWAKIQAENLAPAKALRNPKCFHNENYPAYIGKAIPSTVIFNGYKSPAPPVLGRRGGTLV